MRHAALAVGLLLTAAAALATPDPAKWRRETLLAVNEDSYFVWVSNWGQRGFNHSYEESACIERRLFAGNIVAEVDTFYSASATNIDAPYTWQIREFEHEPFDLSRYLHDRKASLAFGGDWLCDVVVRDGALLLTEGDSTSTVLSADDLARQVPDLGRDPRLAGCWYVSSERGRSRSEYWFYAIRSNSASWDDDWSDILVVVPGAAVRGAAARLPEPQE